MPRLVRSFALALLLLAGTGMAPGGDPQARADSGAAEALLRTRVLGSEDAPVTLEEYSSLTCPHCATFHRAILPQIKANYIDSGKVRMVYYDFPLDPLALAAAMLTRCVADDQYWPFLDRLFLDQATWARAENPGEALAKLAGEAGLDAAGFNACFGNAPLMTGIRDALEQSQQRHDIRSTPTFVINGEKVSGARPYPEFQAIIDRQLAAAAAPAAAPAPAAPAPAMDTPAPSVTGGGDASASPPPAGSPAAVPAAGSN